MRTLLFDIETNGLLKQLNRCHCLVIRDAKTRETFRFRMHDGYYPGQFDEQGYPRANVAIDFSNEVYSPPENTIEEGVRMLMEADVIVGHNVIRFDIPALQKLFPWFVPKGQVKDTLVLVRMIFSDIKEKDYGLVKAKRLPGSMIGAHGLEAWGYRVGLHKGDYTKQCADRAVAPWAQWSPAQEDYCVNDVDVTEVIWAGCQRDMPPETALSLETQIHELSGVMENNGFPFDMAAAETLRADLQSKLDALEAETKARYGRWYAPEKKKYIRPPYQDLDEIIDPPKMTYFDPDPAKGEDDSRAVWGEVTILKKGMRRVKVDESNAGQMVCFVKPIEFNPGSRLHIIDRFITVHGWRPEEFTDKGTPEVNDAVLTKLADTIPEAKPLADIFQLKKTLGALVYGNNSWMEKAKEDSMIHHYLNTGGTVSGRCSHIGPNIGQVNGVITIKVNGKDAIYIEADGSLYVKEKDVTLPAAEWLWAIEHDVVGSQLVEKPNKKNKAILLGKHGDFGFDARSLFFTPKPMVQVGVDLSGIEFRCLAEECVPFDNGALIEVVLHGDIHEINMASLAGVVSQRDIVKRILYGLMYGAGDWKLGFTAKPYAAEQEQRALGAAIRAKLMQGLPALKMAIDKVQAEAAKGYILGLDGRKLKARSKHSALNLRLQGNAALIAKKWVCLTEEYFFQEGWNHGWPGGLDTKTWKFNDYDSGGDFVFYAFVHDELQFAIRPEFAKRAAELCIQAAAAAGKFFNYRCPVDAEAKFGQNWAETH